MRDSIGNSISEKSLLCWHPSADALKRGLLVQAVHVTDGGLSLGDSRELTPAMLIVQIPIYVNAPQGKEPTLEEFLCVVNPQAEVAVSALMDKVGSGRTQ